jgi:hypothetical protein
MMDANTTAELLKHGEPRTIQWLPQQPEGRNATSALCMARDVMLGSQFHFTSFVWSTNEGRTCTVCR